MHSTLTAWLNMLSLKQVIVGNVTFEPACNHWHIHHASEGGGQMLLVTATAAAVGIRNGANRQELHPGDVVNIPANVKHWHGAAKATALSSI